MKREVFISVDIEASGPIPGEYSMLSIGACNVYKPDSNFYAILKPTGSKVDPEALAVTGFSVEALLADGQEPDDAMAKFREWVLATSGDGLPVFVGLNAGFDWSFVNYYFIRYLGVNPFGFAPLDIKAMYMGAKHCSWRETRGTIMKRALGATLQGTHNALEDALYQAELFRLIRG